MRRLRRKCLLGSVWPAEEERSRPALRAGVRRRRVLLGACRAPSHPLPDVVTAPGVLPGPVKSASVQFVGLGSVRGAGPTANVLTPGSLLSRLHTTGPCLHTAVSSSNPFHPLMTCAPRRVWPHGRVRARVALVGGHLRTALARDGRHCAHAHSESLVGEQLGAFAARTRCKSEQLLRQLNDPSYLYGLCPWALLQRGALGQAIGAATRRRHACSADRLGV